MAAAPFNPEAGARDSLTAYLDAHRAIIRSECDYVELPRHRVRTLHPGLPCESCGSVEYVPHSGLMICSYCRTPQEGVGAPKPVTRTALELEQEAAFRSAKRRVERELAYEQARAMNRADRAISYGKLIGNLWG